MLSCSSLSQIIAYLDRAPTSRQGSFTEVEEEELDQEGLHSVLCVHVLLTRRAHAFLVAYI